MTRAFCWLRATARRFFKYRGSVRTFGTGFGSVSGCMPSDRAALTGFTAIGATPRCNSWKKARSLLPASRSAFWTARLTVADISFRLAIAPLFVSHRLNRAHDVHQPAPLEVWRAVQVGRGRQKHPLHFFWLLQILAPDRQKRGNHAGDMWRRLARSRILAIQRDQPTPLAPRAFRTARLPHLG